MPTATHVALPFTIPFFNRRLKPQLDEAQDVPVNDAPSD